MKWVGALLIIFASAAIGRFFAMAYRDRPRQLRQLRTALQSLETEITYGLSPIGEAAERLAGQLPEPGKSLFATFADRLNSGNYHLPAAWKAALDEVWPHTALKNAESEILRQFGETLGQSDRENQQKQIRLVLSHLEREENDAREDQGRYEKMLNSLGLLAGLLLALILL